VFISEIHLIGGSRNAHSHRRKVISIFYFPRNSWRYKAENMFGSKISTIKARRVGCFSLVLLLVVKFLDFLPCML
jgi:hypothetical protein